MASYLFPSKQTTSFSQSVDQALCIFFFLFFLGLTIPPWHTSFPVPPEVNSGKPQPNAASAASPGSPPSHRHMTMEPSEPQRRTSKPKRTRQVERRCSSSSSSQHWVSRPDQTRTHSESSECGIETCNNESQLINSNLYKYTLK